MNKTVVVAIGGNAITQSGQKGTVEEQFENVRNCCDPIIDLAADGYNVVLTHGNGPQVGCLLLQNEAAKDIVPVNPMDVLGAQTQGSLGYIITQTLLNRMKERGIAKPVATVVTQVVVDKNDPKFANPSKPVGPFYSKEEAEILEKTKHYIMVEDSGRGYRRVVPSPMPLEIIEKESVMALADKGFIVLTVGGGGIPVIKEDGMLKGVEAVIDKDQASAMTALEIKADALLILTGVEQVAINFGKPDMQNLSTLSVADAKKYMAEGQFPAGSMGPKIEAVCRFVENGGKEAIITSIERLKDALDGKTGTRITL